MPVKGVRQLPTGEQQIFLIRPAASRSQVPVDVNVGFSFDILKQLVVIQVFPRRRLEAGKVQGQLFLRNREIRCTNVARQLAVLLVISSRGALVPTAACQT
ncbi:hypothetical protein D3C71_1935450 [compost metagenome]